MSCSPTACNSLRAYYVILYYVQRKSQSPYNGLQALHNLTHPPWPLSTHLIAHTVVKFTNLVAPGGSPQVCQACSKLKAFILDVPFAPISARLTPSSLKALTDQKTAPLSPHTLGPPSPHGFSHHYAPLSDLLWVSEWSRSVVSDSLQPRGM